jgi:hypothetical protein
LEAQRFLDLWVWDPGTFYQNLPIPGEENQRI